jgi:hypothetical protein
MAEVTEIQVRERLDEVEALISQHEVALAYLRQESTELNTAVRVFDRFHSRPDYSGILPAHPSPVAPEADLKKPAGIPRMSEMIITVLREYDLIGPMEPKEIAEWIRKRWWPEAPSTSVGPTAWRMWKEGRLIKEGAAYSLPKDETPTVGPVGVSERDEADFGLV